MNTNEALSALMDGEDTPDDMDRIICSIDIDNALASLSKRSVFILKLKKTS